MVISCSAINCNNRQNCGKSALQFHRFPLKNEILCQKWVLAMKKDNWKPTRFSRICSEHFTEDDYKTKTKCRKYLKPHAVPSIFNLQKCQKGREINLQNPVKETKRSSDVDATDILPKQYLSVESSTSTFDLRKYQIHKEIQTDKIRPVVSLSYQDEEISYQDKGIQTLKVVGPKEVKLRQKIMHRQMKLHRRTKKLANLQIILQYVTNICKMDEDELAKLDEKFGEGLWE